MREADLEQLYTRLERPLYNVVFRWVWNPEEAEEIVQEAFVRLWGMRRRIDPGRVQSLVYKIALNLASSRRRAKRIRRWVSLDLLRERPSAEADAEQEMSAVERKAMLRRALDSLPEDLRGIVMLCEFSDMSYEEIGGIFSIPAGTVGSRRNRALRRLKELLSEGEGGDE
jgi:RNA polymerase sigma-70 factor (ECF subfamily)